MLHEDVAYLLDHDAEAELCARLYVSRQQAIEAIPVVERVCAAATLYRERRDRLANPAGRFDRQGRFWLASQEECPLCAAIRRPSVAWPYSLLLHARTARHIAALRGLPVEEVRAEARQQDQQQSQGKAA